MKLFDRFRTKKENKRLNIQLSALSKSIRRTYEISNNKELLDAINEIDEVRSVIRKMSTILSKVQIKHEQQLNGVYRDISERSNLIKLLNNPDPNNSKNTFFYSTYFNFLLFDSFFVYPQNLKRPNLVNDYNSLDNLILLEGELVELSSNLNLLFKEGVSNLSFKYENVLDNVIKEFTAKNLIYCQNIENSTLNKTNIALSKWKSVIKKIMLIKYLHGAFEIMATKRGAIGIISPDAKASDATGAVPYHNDDKKALQKEYSKYGFSKDQWQLVISNVPVTFTSIDPDYSKMQFFEIMQDCKNSIAQTLSVSPLWAYADGEGSTFSNQDTVTKAVANFVILPHLDLIKKAYSNFFKLDEKGERLVFSIDFGFTASDEKLKNESTKIRSEAISLILGKYNANSLTESQARYILQNDFDVDSEEIDNLLIKDNENE